jgi:hypothetical protein
MTRNPIPGAGMNSLVSSSRLGCQLGDQIICVTVFSFVGDKAKPPNTRLAATTSRSAREANTCCGAI